MVLGPLGRDSVILIVDDERDTCETLRQFLELAVPGVRIVTAGSGEEGLGVLASSKVALILTDYRMPGMNGLEFLEKAKEVCPLAQRILLTAFPDMGLALQALRDQRVVQVFRKPFDPEEVREVVAGLLGKTFSPDQRAAAARRSLDISRRRPAKDPG